MLLLFLSCYCCGFPFNCYLRNGASIDPKGSHRDLVCKCFILMIPDTLSLITAMFVSPDVNLYRGNVLAFPLYIPLYVSLTVRISAFARFHIKETTYLLSTGNVQQLFMIVDFR